MGTKQALLSGWEGPYRNASQSGVSESIYSIYIYIYICTVGYISTRVSCLTFFINLSPYFYPGLPDALLLVLCRLYKKAIFLKFIFRFCVFFLFFFFLVTVPRSELRNPHTSFSQHGTLDAAVLKHTEKSSTHTK